MATDKTIKLGAVNPMLFSTTEDADHEFELVGYTGKIMEKGNWKGIFKLDGIESKDGEVIVLREHDHDKIVGHGKVSVDERGLIIKGNFSSRTKDGVQVKGLLEEGVVKLQCSVGIQMVKGRMSDGDEIINGIMVPRGVQIWTESYMGEVSICSWGVDTDTSVIKKFAHEVVGESMDETKETVEEIIELTDVVEDESMDTSDTEETVEVEEPSVDSDDVEPVSDEADEPEVETEAPVAEEPAEEAPVEKELSVDDAIACAVADAVATERARVNEILTSGAPIEFAVKGIEDGMSKGEFFEFAYKAEKANRADGLAEMAAEAQDLETPAEKVELSFMDMVELHVGAGLSKKDAMLKVRSESPSAFKQFIS